MQIMQSTGNRRSGENLIKRMMLNYYYDDQRTVVATTAYNYLLIIMMIALLSTIRDAAWCRSGCKRLTVHSVEPKEEKASTERFYLISD